MADGGEAVGRKPRGRHPDKRLSQPYINSAGPGRHADGNGLYLEVEPNGSKRWTLRTMVRGRRKDIGLGGTSYVTLAEAREMARRLRRVAREGGDPVAERDQDKRKSITFEEAARKVHAANILPANRNAKANAQWLSSMEAYAFPKMGKRPVFAVEQADVLRALGPIWLTKKETAKRVKQRIKTVLDWARANGMGEGNHPCEGIEKALPRQNDEERHHKALPYAKLPELWPRLEAMDGMGALALRFTILTAARSGEVRGATWGEFDLDAKEWTVPADRMKAGKEHRVPLSGAAITVLRQAKAQALRAGEALVFPSMKPGRPLSDMTLAAVLKRPQAAGRAASTSGSLACQVLTSSSGWSTVRGASLDRICLWEAPGRRGAGKLARRSALVDSGVAHHRCSGGPSTPMRGGFQDHIR